MNNMRKTNMNVVVNLTKNKNKKKEKKRINKSPTKRRNGPKIHNQKSIESEFTKKRTRKKRRKGKKTQSDENTVISIIDSPKRSTITEIIELDDTRSFSDSDNEEACEIVEFPRVNVLYRRALMPDKSGPSTSNNEISMSCENCNNLNTDENCTRKSSTMVINGKLYKVKSREFSYGKPQKINIFSKIYSNMPMKCKVNSHKQQKQQQNCIDAFRASMDNVKQNSVKQKELLRLRKLIRNVTQSSLATVKEAEMCSALRLNDDDNDEEKNKETKSSKNELEQSVIIVEPPPNVNLPNLKPKPKSPTNNLDSSVILIEPPNNDINLPEFIPLESLRINLDDKNKVDVPPKSSKNNEHEQEPQKQTRKRTHSKSIETNSKSPLDDVIVLDDDDDDEPFQNVKRRKRNRSKKSKINESAVNLSPFLAPPASNAASRTKSNFRVISPPPPNIIDNTRGNREEVEKPNAKSEIMEWLNKQENPSLEKPNEELKDSPESPPESTYKSDDDQDQVQPSSSNTENVSNKFGSNLYNPNTVVRKGLRTIVIDGSNVALGHTNGRYFSVKGLKICIDYFKSMGHTVKAFVPQFRINTGECSDPSLLRYLAKEGVVIFTPSRVVQGRRIVPYDDRFIVQYAAECDGVIVSNDHYRDIMQENVNLQPTIENRLLMFTWVDDMIIFPPDPLGQFGPKLDEFLRFPMVEEAISCNAVIVSNDTFDHFKANNYIAGRYVDRNLLMYVFVDDVIMFPNDPRGRKGPSLKQVILQTAKQLDAIIVTTATYRKSLMKEPDLAEIAKNNILSYDFYGDQITLPHDYRLMKSR